MDRPAIDEIEITIFGPGFGESILIHFGENRWAIIDSCIDRKTGQPAALIYLQKIGVNPAVAVGLIAATHWHDDHIGGLSSIVKACSAAKFACAAATTKKEFVNLATVFNKKPMLVGPVGSQEFHSIFTELQKAKRTPIRVVANRPFFTRKNPSTGAIDYRLTALSPSDLEMDRFLKSMTKLLPQDGARKYRIPDPQPNELSVAMLVQIGETTVLLGADVEEHGDPKRGWSAILASEDRPSGKASVFKVAHHGAASGHHDGIWTTLLEGNPVAVLTPWNRGGGLPTGPDRTRILARTQEAYATSRAASRRAKRLPPAVMRTLSESGIKIMEAESPTGFVRLRKIKDKAWTIALFDPARPLKDYAA